MWTRVLMCRQCVPEASMSSMALSTCVGTCMPLPACSQVMFEFCSRAGSKANATEGK